ncbi:MAG: winged helix-turn-helix domain-containing protein [Lachnospiraceae bacterium]|nr:winged helix-turn-helix domain-containing protein [Lachnospiraceae bacterium]
MDVLFIMMEQVHEGFYEELMKLIVQYGYNIDKATYAANDISLGELKIIPSKRQVFLYNQEISMTSKEFDILEFLAKNRGQVFSKEQIYDRIWGEYYVADDRNITAYINKIRKKIEPDQSKPIYIQTVWGVGYKFNEKINRDV